MDRRVRLIATVLAMLVAVAGPIALALQLARQQAVAAQTQQALGHARDVVARADALADELDTAFDALAAAPGPDPCSSDRLDLMRRLDLGAGRVEALGWIAGDALLCFSAQRSAAAIGIGPVDSVLPDGDRLRHAVRIGGSSAPELRAVPVPFLVVERGGHAALLRRDLLLEVASGQEQVLLALLAGTDAQVLAARGEIRPEWLSALRGAAEATRVEAGHVLAFVPSQRHAFAAVAAAPTAASSAAIATMAWLLVPTGIAAGLVMVLAVHHESKRRLALPAVLHSALRRQEFFLAYQPVIDLATRQWVGAEALIRWQRHNGEVVQPHEFLSAAEDAGLIQCITRRVFELVARDAAGLFAQYPQFQLALNLTAADLHDETTVAQLRALAEKLHARPGNLVIEAGERGFANPRLAGLIVERLYSAGMRVAIDDFGVGNSSLSHLQRIKLDYLKIDRSFIETIGTGAATSEVVLHIIEIGQALKLEMIAEGVESEAQADFLRERGVRFAQGWLFARPLSLSELRVRLAQQQAAAAA